MSAPETNDLKGPINKYRRKGDLQDIANALKIDSVGTVMELVARINNHLADNPTLVEDARFQSLFVYRTAGKGKVTAASKETGKTSADKAAEDEKEDENPPVLPTGAYKTLQDLKVTRDPPASFKPLEATKGAASVTAAKSNQMSDAKWETSGGSEGSGEEGDELGRSSPEPEAVENENADTEEAMAMLQSMAPSTPKKDKATKPDIVVVNFHDIANPMSAPRQVLIPRNELSVVADDSEDGTITVRLTDLLPAAIEQDTPMKERGGRLYRRSQFSGGHIPLGSVESILSNSGRETRGQISLAKVNEYKMYRSDDGTAMLCDVLWEKSETGKHNTAKTEGPSKAPETKETEDSGEETDSQAAPDTGADAVDGDQFYEFLRKRPIYGYSKGSSIARSEPLGSRGWRSQAHTDLKLFSKDVLEKIPKIKAWVDNPEGR